MTEQPLTTPPRQFSLRALFVAMTIAAVGCVIIRTLWHVPFLGLLVVTYVPLIIIYGLIRGPFLWHRWKLLRRQYDAVAEQRRTLLRQAGVEMPEDSKSDELDSQSSVCPAIALAIRSRALSDNFEFSGVSDEASPRARRWQAS